MQIRYETTKLTKHPTNNRSSPEWSSSSESTSKRINKSSGISSAMSSARITLQITVGDDVVGDHVNKLFKVCFQRPCSEKGSDAAEPTVNNQNKFQIATTVQQIEGLKKTTWRFLGWASSHFWKLAGTPDWSGLVSPPIASVFVGSRLAMVLLPPA